MVEIWEDLKSIRLRKVSGTRLNWPDIQCTPSCGQLCTREALQAEVCYDRICICRTSWGSVTHRWAHRPTRMKRCSVSCLVTGCFISGSLLPFSVLWNWAQIPCCSHLLTIFSDFLLSSFLQKLPNTVSTVSTKCPLIPLSPLQLSKVSFKPASSHFVPVCGILQQSPSIYICKRNWSVIQPCSVAKLTNIIRPF